MKFKVKVDFTVSNVVSEKEAIIIVAMSLGTIKNYSLDSEVDVKTDSYETEEIIEIEKQCPKNA